MYPRLNQGEWVSLLVHSQHKLDSEVEHRAIEKYTASMASSNKKKKKTKRNLSESDLENEAADFPRFIVIESLEEVYQVKFWPFLIEKLFLQGLLQKLLRIRNGNLLVEVDSRRQVFTFNMLSAFHTTKCGTLPYERLNTTRGIIRSRELVLATEGEIAPVLGKQSYKYKKNLH